MDKADSSIKRSKRSRKDSDDEEFEDSSPNKRLCVEDRRPPETSLGNGKHSDKEDHMNDNVIDMTLTESNQSDGDDPLNNNARPQGPIDNDDSEASTGSDRSDYTPKHIENVNDNRRIENINDNQSIENINDQNGNVRLRAAGNNTDEMADDLDPDNNDLDPEDDDLDPEDNDSDPDDSDDLSLPDVHHGQEFEFQWPHSPSDVDQRPLRNWEESVCNPLYRRVSTGNIEAVGELLSSGHDPNQAYYYDGLFDYSALHRAVLLFRLPMVQVLLDGGCLPDKRDKNGFTPFMIALSSGQYEVATLLLKAGADVNAVNCDGRSAVMECVSNGEGVDFLLAAKANVNISDVFGSTALLDACTRGCLESVKKLISAGADINIVDREGQTALMCAANNCAGEIAQLLLENGADINAGNFRGITALQHAAAVPKGHIMMEALLKAGCDPDHLDGLGHTPMVYAIEMARPVNVRCLVLANAKVDYKFPMFGLEFTPFQLAFLQCHELLKGVPEGGNITPGELSKVSSLLIILHILSVAGARVLARTGKVAEQLKTVRKAVTILAQRRVEYEDEPDPSPNTVYALSIWEDFRQNHTQYLSIIDEITNTLHTPRTLKDLTRLKLRSFFKTNPNDTFSKLGLPTILLNYLQFHHLKNIEMKN